MALPLRKLALVCLCTAIMLPSSTLFAQTPAASNQEKKDTGQSGGKDKKPDWQKAKTEQPQPQSQSLPQPPAQPQPQSQSVPQPPAQPQPQKK